MSVKPGSVHRGDLIRFDHKWFPNSMGEVIKAFSDCVEVRMLSGMETLVYYEQIQEVKRREHRNAKR